MMTRLKKLFNYIESPRDFFLFSQIFIFLTILPLLLKLFSLKKLMEVLSSDSKENRDVDADKILKLTNLILHRDIFIYKNICLKRSLTLYYFLSRMGQNVNIYYGVKKDTELNNEDQGLDGHSWIKLNGEILNDGDKNAPDIYHITYSYPD